MTRSTIFIVAIIAATAAHSAPLATEGFVTNKIAAAIAAIPDPDFSTNNTELVATIEATAPTPDFSTNNTELVETIEEVAPVPDLSPFLRNDKTVGQIQTFGGMLKGKFLTDSWYSYIVNNPAATPSSQTLPLYVGSTISNTVPAWARAATKPTYTAAEVGAWPAVEGSEWGLGSAGLTMYLRSGYLSGSYCFGMDSEWHVMRRLDLEDATNATLAAAMTYTDNHTPDVGSAISNIVTAAYINDRVNVTPLAGRTYDFATNIGLYTAVRDVILALGGSVTNFPAIPQN